MEPPQYEASTTLGKLGEYCWVPFFGSFTGSGRLVCGVMRHCNVEVRFPREGLEGHIWGCYIGLFRSYTWLRSGYIQQGLGFAKINFTFFGGPQNKD